MTKKNNVLAEYKRQYLDEFKDQEEPLIVDSSRGNGIEMDIMLPFDGNFYPFRVIYNNSEWLELICMDTFAKYIYKTKFLEIAHNDQPHLDNLIIAASGIMERNTLATEFAKSFALLTKSQFRKIPVDNFDPSIASEYCKHGYCGQTIQDVYRLLSYCYTRYPGTEMGRVNVDSYEAKHVFEELLSHLCDTTYVHTEEFTAALVMFAKYEGIFDTLKLKKDGPNYNMVLPDFYRVLRVNSGRI